MFGRRKPYSRRDSLDRADRLRAKGQRKKAIVEYRKILEQDPNDRAIQARLAPLLAETGQAEEALEAFNTVAAGYKKDGFLEKASGIVAHAARYFPLRTAIWEQLAELAVARGNRAEAVSVLLEGRSHFRGRKQREEAIGLLRQALVLDPDHVFATIDLSKLLKRQGAKAEAVEILAQLVERTQGRSRRRIRYAQFWLEPSFGAAWRWARGK
jgi:tetratricopeptide (TPR) repeat protein